MNIDEHRRFGRGQAGEGRVGLIIAILVIVGVVYLLKLTVPLRIDNAELAEFAEQRTRLFVVNQVTQEAVVTSIVAEAGKIGLPVTEESITIDNSETRVIIKISYDITQKLVGGKEWTQHFEIEREVPRL